MGICYGKISFVLWGKSTVRENATSDLVHQRKLIAKRKVMKYWTFDAVNYGEIRNIPADILFKVSYQYYISGGEDVYSCSNCLCHMLASLPFVLYFYVSLQRIDEKPYGPTRVPGILLAGNVKLNV